MSKVQQLEEALRKAKDEERRTKLEKELDDLKKRYEDKCYCTHTFQKKRTTMHFRMIWIKKVEFATDDGDGSNIRFHSEIISYSRDSKRMTRFDFSVSQFTDPRNSYENYKYEISKDNFLSVKAQVHGNLDALFDVIRDNMKQDVMVTNGEAGEEEGAIRLMKNSGAKYVDTTRYAGDGFSRNVMEILRWNHHPLMIGEFMIVNQTSKKMTQDIVDKLKDSARHWGSSVYDRDMPRALALQKFIDEVNWVD